MSKKTCFQAILIAVQLGNVQCVQGAYGESAFEELDRDIHYGNTGCRVFKLGVQNYKDFCLKINILKGNY